MATSEMVDQGTAYGRRPGIVNRDLTDTAPGTRMGTLLRRYWHPVGLSSDATTRPKAIRALSEDLILFRDGKGRPGLLYPRCAHRGTTLYYGKVEERGIRCCYHGWLFDAEGRCLEQPCEAEGGRHRDNARQPWYPVEERYGLIFAYMGPPEKKPALPRWDVLEACESDETIVADDHIQSGPKLIPCNWTHHFDNVPDHFHVPILHGSNSGTQFVELMSRMPQITWERTERGVKTMSRRKLENGKTLLRIVEGVLPTMRLVPDPGISRYGKSESMSWLLPVDDTHHMLYAALKRKPGWSRAFTRPGGMSWDEMTAAQHQQYPDDFEAQTGQGPITLHSEEHLATTDQGLVMLRRFLLQQVEAVAAGTDPVGVRFDAQAAPEQTEAGNFLLES
ncbi:MAG TPA: Rieske 2Fe-2S domain-containing protein [Stellaceae bacterium]|nr:Rieske 2Fe-2S domain-containing protein [Stellaceae bacterium]